MRVLAAVVATIAVLAATWLAFDRGAVSGPAPAGAVAQRGGAVMPADPARGVAEDPQAAPISRADLAATDRRLARLRGRCVDGAGMPLAACGVRLHGEAGSRARMEQWLTDHRDPPTWQDPMPTTTGSDGRFQFAFWPPPPYQFALDIEHEHHGATSGRWLQLREGAEVDVGDVVLQPGVRVHGRVVDEAGVPQDRQSVTLAQAAAAEPDGVVRPRSTGQATSKADGTFELDSPLVPGSYDVHCQDMELLTPKSVPLAADRPEEVVKVVVRTVPRISITGRVLDEIGVAAADVSIEERTELGGVSTLTDANGVFELRQRLERARATARLSLYGDAYEVDPEQLHEVAWGTRDVELRVARAGSLTLRVTDAAQQPIDNYTVRLLPHHGTRWSPTDARARAQGAHPDGTVVIAGLRHGEWLLLVDFPAATGMPPLCEMFRQEVAGNRRLDLRAVGPVMRTLRVVAGGDALVAGSKVQVCELFGHPLDDERHVLRREPWLQDAMDARALVLFEGATGADGRLQLRGPGGRELGLCLLGPGHVPMRLSGVRLDEDGELVVRVGRGARLTGRVVPPEAVVELKRWVEVAATDRFPQRYRPKLDLIGPSGARFLDVLGADEQDGTRVFLADDGSFDVDGVPPGSWKLSLTCWTRHGGNGSTESFDAGTAVLSDGQALQRDVDLQAILPGTLEGLVLLNGAPLANGRVLVQNERRGDTLPTDAEGRFTCRCLPGEYQVRAERRNPGGVWSELQCPERARVVRGATTRQTFTASSGRLQVTLRNAAGTLVADANLYLGFGKRGAILPPTGTDGRSEAEFPAETVTLWILPKQLNTAAEQRRLWGNVVIAGANPDGPQLLQLATVTLAPGQLQSLELKLPADSGY